VPKSLHIRKQGFAQKCRTEVLPSINGDMPSVCVNWMGGPGNALPQIYAMSCEPEFLKKMWMAAWPPSFWHDKVNGSMYLDDGPDCDSDRQEVWWAQDPYITGSCVQIHILISSSKALQLPWDWLYGPFLEAAVPALAAA